MGIPFKNPARFRQNLFRFYVTSFLLSIIGAAVLFIPKLESFAFNIMKVLDSPGAGPALWRTLWSLLAEAILAFIGIVGMFCIGIDWFFFAPRRR